MDGKNISVYLNQKIIDQLDEEACLTNQSRGQVITRALTCLRCYEQNVLPNMILEELDKRFARLYEYVDRKIAELREAIAASHPSDADK